MGDKREITTWPKHKNLYYEVSSGAMFFDVKGFGNAGIHLAIHPKDPSQLLIVLGLHQNKCMIIIEGHADHRYVETPNILSPVEYRRFWILWDSKRVLLGREGETKPLLSHDNPISHLRYISFDVYEDFRPVHWKFELPPALEKTLFKPITGGGLKWVPMTKNDSVPVDAVIGGYENEILYIIRAPYEGSLTPGKFVPSKRIAYVSNSWNAIEKNEFEILCGINYMWVLTMGAQIPVGTVVAGYSENRAERLYIGRGKVDGHVIPGKVHPTHSTCYLAYGDREISVREYEILVDPDTYKTYVQRDYSINNISFANFKGVEN